MRLINLILLLPLFFGYFSFSFAQISVQPSYKQLVWDDFQGTCDDCEDEPFAAYSALNVSVIPMSCDSNICQLSVCASFFNSKAWVNPVHKTTDLLNHEQRHFDIYEIGARLVREEIGKKIYKKYSNCLFDAFELASSIQKEFINPTTTLYDQQTNHSINKEQQKIWDRRIQIGLDSLRSYANEIIIKNVESMY